MGPCCKIKTNYDSKEGAALPIIMADEICHEYLGQDNDIMVEQA